MDSIKIGSFTLHIDNGGLLIILTTGDKEDTYRFDPKESANLLDFLAQHQHEFNAAIKSPEAVFPIVTRKQVEAWLEQACNESIPPELHIILDTRHPDKEWVGLDWSNANLKGSMLSQVNLAGSSFHDAHLEGTDFTWSSLENCDLEGATLVDASLDLTDCTCARFVRARLVSCKANSAEFREANFKGATLTGSSFVYGDFRGADLSGADLTGCNLQGCEFGGANLRGAILKGANISDSRFDRASLIDANLEEASTKDGIIIDQQTEWRPRSGITAILREPPLDDLE